MSQKNLHDLIFGNLPENDFEDDYQAKKINSTKGHGTFKDLYKQSQRLAEKQIPSPSQLAPVDHVEPKSQFSPSQFLLPSTEKKTSEAKKKQKKGKFNNYKEFKDIFSQRFHESQMANPFGESIEPGWIEFCQSNNLTGESFLSFFRDNQHSDIRRIENGEFRNEKLKKFFGRIKSLELQNKELVFAELDNPTGKVDCFFDKSCFNYALRNISFSQSQSQRNQSMGLNSDLIRSELRTVTIDSASNEGFDKPPFNIGIILELHLPSLVSLDRQNYFLLVKPQNIAKFYVNSDQI